MLSLKALDIYSVAQPIHFWSKILGLTSFSIDKEKGKFVVKTTLFSVLTLILSTVCSLGMGVVYVCERTLFVVSGDISPPNSFEKTATFVMFGFFFISFLSIWWIFFAQNSFCKILNLLAEVDEGLAAMNLPINLTKHKKVVWVIILATKTFMLLIVSTSYSIQLAFEFYQPSVIVFLNMCFVIELGLLTIIQYVLILWAVKLRYEKINVLLGENFFASLSDLKDGNKKLSKAAELHNKLAEVSEAINRSFGVPALLMTANQFTFITLNIFSLTKLWLALDSKVTATFGMMVFWTLNDALTLVIILYAAHVSRREVRWD